MPNPLPLLAAISRMSGLSFVSCWAAMYFARALASPKVSVKSRSLTETSIPAPVTPFCSAFHSSSVKSALVAIDPPLSVEPPVSRPAPWVGFIPRGRNNATGSRREALVDRLEHLEHRHVHRDDDHADDQADAEHHDRLDDRGQGADCGVHLVLVEVGHLAQHLVELARLLADLHHLAD